MSTFIVKNNCVKCNAEIGNSYNYGMCMECHKKMCSDCGKTLKYKRPWTDRKCIECCLLKICDEFSSGYKACDNKALVDDMIKALNNLKKKLI